MLHFPAQILAITDLNLFSLGLQPGAPAQTHPFLFNWFQLVAWSPFHRLYFPRTYAFPGIHFVRSNSLSADQNHHQTRDYREFLHFIDF
jgi:hypothetical protein